jgi:transcription-repair coupling factor (superfamily II helicase)
VTNLLAVARFRLLARQAGLTEIVTQGTFIRFGPASLPDSKNMRLIRLYPRTVIKEAAGFVLVPRPLSATIGGPQIQDLEILDWAAKVINDVFLA